MSMLSWIFPRKKAVHSVPDSSGLSRVEPTRPLRRDGHDSVPEAAAQPANRKSERMARREQLYTVVRECMVRAGVLSSSYRFKVLSLDGRGRQFLVMVDLSHDSVLQARQFSETETLIAQAAKARHDIVVTSVYWRIQEYVAVGDPAAAAGAVTADRDAQVAGASQLAETPRAAHAAHDNRQPAPATPQAPRSAFEPIRDDEVAAFRQALAAGVARPAAAAAAAVGIASATATPAPSREPKPSQQNYALLTGFEDTEMTDAPQAPMLSSTQYGDLN